MVKHLACEDGPLPVDIYVGKRVREARVARGLNQTELGEKLGVSFQQVQKYEKGTNRIGSSRLWDIAQSLDMPISFFFEGLEGGQEEQAKKIPGRVIHMAHEIFELENEKLREQILGLIKICAPSNDAEELKAVGE